MTTDTKAVARYRAVLSHGLIEVEAHPIGSFVLFTDHERVVGELTKNHKENLDSWLARGAEISRLRTALTASRAEVEGLKKLLPEVRMCVEYAIDYGSPSRRSERKELINTIDAAMEKGNV